MEISARRVKEFFFGLNNGNCNGRLTFYCQKVLPDEREKIYGAVDTVLDKIEIEIANCAEVDVICKIAAKSIADLNH